MTPEVREVLMHRSVRDKIAVVRNCALCPVKVLPIISELVREGYLVWLDRAGLPMMIEGYGGMIVDCDIYLLTPKGVGLCELNEIPQR